MADNQNTTSQQSGMPGDQPPSAPTEPGSEQQTGHPVPPGYNDPPPPYPGLKDPQPPPAGFVYSDPAAGSYPQGPQVVHHHVTAGGDPMQQITITEQPASVVVVRHGNCPKCQIGIIVEDFTCLGICLGIFFFPFGLLCCLALRQRRCSQCGSTF